MPKLLTIESSCDETAAAIVEYDERPGGTPRIVSSVVASQDKLHERFGGVVPEIASRAHIERMLPVIHEALSRAATKLDDLAAVAVVNQPGLVGSLLVGLTAAKTLALVLGVPLVAVNHIEAHIYACRLAAACDIFPCVGFVVSGGHTSLFHCRSATDFELLGSTTDDAAGEAFDKVASMLGLGFPGGPAVQRAAETGNPAAYRFPRTWIKDERLDFSFSGIKTAVLYTVWGQDARGPGGENAARRRGKSGAERRALRAVGDLNPQQIADVAASFQQAVVDVLVAKAEQALERTGLERLAVGGGVAANKRFRERLAQMAARRGAELIIAPMQLCTDNAAMAAIAVEHLRQARTAPLDLDVVAGLYRSPQPA